MLLLLKAPLLRRGLPDPAAHLQAILYGFAQQQGEYEGAAGCEGVLDEEHAAVGQSVSQEISHSHMHVLKFFESGLQADSLPDSQFDWETHDESCTPLSVQWSIPSLNREIIHQHQWRSKLSQASFAHL